MFGNTGSAFLLLYVNYDCISFCQMKIYHLSFTVIQWRVLSILDWSEFRVDVESYTHVQHADKNIRKMFLKYPSVVCVGVCV